MTTYEKLKAYTENRKKQNTITFQGFTPTKPTPTTINPAFTNAWAQAAKKAQEESKPKPVTANTVFAPVLKGLSDTARAIETFGLKNPLTAPTRESGEAAGKWIYETISGKKVSEGYSPTQLGLNFVQQGNEAWAQNAASERENRGKVYNTLADLGEVVGGALPQAAMAIASGGTSIPATLSASTPGISSAVVSGASKLAQNPLFWTSYAQSAGGVYNEAIANGATEKEAQLTSTISGLLQAGVEVSGGLETLPAAVKNGGSSAILQWVKSSIDEGKEEVIQGVIDRLTSKVVYDQEKPLVSTTNPSAVINPFTSAQEFTMGTAAGGILGGGQLATQGVVNTLKPKPTPTQPSTTPQNVTQPTPISTVGQQAQNAVQTVAQPNVQVLPEGMGAASDKFDPVNQLVEKYGAIKPGENPVTTERVVELPKKTSDNLNLSQTVRTAMEATATTNETADKIEQATLNEDFSYEVNTDKGAVERARQTIEYKGYDSALRDWTADMRSGKVGKDLTAVGWTLYNNAANSGNAKQAVEILTDIVNSVRASAQTVQAVRLLKKMEPEYQLYSVQRSVQNLKDELVQKYGNKAPDLKINDALAQEYLDALKAKDDVKAKQALDKIYKNIASQVPSTFMDKWNAWRYMAMLMNPITHIKNIVGNYTFRAERAVKNVIATAIEAGTQKLGGNIERTRSILTPKDSKLIQSALKDFDNVSDEIFKIGKFDNAENKIKEYRTIFNNRVLEWLRKANMTALETEDSWVAKPAYAKALARYLKANGTTLKSNNTALLDRARAYAILEAQKASYRDSNAFSDFVAKLGAGRFSGSKVGKGANVLLEGILPFKRTPANILVRGVEYSPVGLAKALTADVYRLKSGEITSGQFIDNISSGLVGTGLMGLGMLLASWGVISVGSTGDDKEDKFNENQGKQAFALTIGGTSYTIDWLAPANMPLFVGVALYNKLTDKSDSGISFPDAIKLLSDVSDPVLETSMLRSLSDFLEGFGFAKQQDENLIWYAVSQMALGYLGQAVPTIFGRINRTIDPTRRTVFTDPQSNVPTDLQYFAGQVLNKIPGASSANQPYVDQWGNQQKTDIGTRFIQNWLSPGYIKEVKTSPMEKELQRLYDSYGKENEVNVLPPTSIKKYFSNNGEDVYMNAQEYTQYKTTYGQYAYNELTKLTGSQAYKKMSDADKAKAVADVYSQAAEKAKTQVMESRGELRIPTAQDGAKIQSYVELGISEKQAYSLHQAIKALDDPQKTDKVNVILNQKYNAQQSAALIGTLYTSHDEDTGEIKDESMLPALKYSDHLLNLYSMTKDTGYINMAIPYSITSNKEELVLTPAERELYKKTFIEYYNRNVTNLKTKEAILAYIKGAKDYARSTVLASRAG